jgi:hypothetical protein
MCGDDPSEHLLISENGTGWHCHRSPQRHKGSSPVRLLQLLLPGTSRMDVAKLLNDFSSAGIAVPTRVHQRLDPKGVEVQWSRFLPAYKSAYCLDYLFKRGFPDQIALCHRYDLRFALTGKWAARILLPLHNYHGEQIGWTGRAMRDSLEPRYNTEIAEPGALYLPRPMRAMGLVVEGPFDALKIAVATEHMAVTPVAVLGLNADIPRLHALNLVLQNCAGFSMSFDRDVLFPIYQGFLGGLAPRLKTIYKGRVSIPPQFEDAGDMPIPAISEWIAGETKP